MKVYKGCRAVVEQNYLRITGILDFVRRLVSWGTLVIVIIIECIE
jgi:hypothetical protein